MFVAAYFLSSIPNASNAHLKLLDILFMYQYFSINLYVSFQIYGFENGDGIWMFAICTGNKMLNTLTQMFGSQTVDKDQNTKNDDSNLLFYSMPFY